MVQAVSERSFGAEAWCHLYVKPRGISYGENGTWKDFSSSTSILPSQCYCIDAL